MDEGREIRVSGKHDPAEITPESDRQTDVFGRERDYFVIWGVIRNKEERSYTPRTDRVR